MRRKEDKYRNHTVQQGGDYELCFINRYSMMETKKIVWELVWSQ